MYCKKNKLPTGYKFKDNSVEQLEYDLNMDGVINNIICNEPDFISNSGNITIKCNEEYFIPGRDFQNPQQIVDLLENFEVSKYTDQRRALERVKTLNFHINTAFGRLDQLLRKIETKINTEDEHKSTD